MCSEPAMRAPFSGFFGPNSSRVAIRPGISVSASEISLRPKSASLMSLTMYSDATGMTVPVLAVEKRTRAGAAVRSVGVAIAGAGEGGKKDIKNSLYADLLRWNRWPPDVAEGALDSKGYRNIMTDLHCSIV